MSPRFRKKPVVIEALQWDGDNNAALRVEIRGLPGAGWKWNLRAIPYGAPAFWGRMVYRTRGSTGRTLKLQPIGLLQVHTDQSEEEQVA